MDIAPQTPVPSTPVGTIAHLDRAQLSPMHPARPPLRGEDEEATEIEIANSDSVVENGTSSKLVDVIFSPMLKFLGADGAEGEEENAQVDHEALMAETANDEARILSNANHGSNELSSTHKTVSHEDDEHGANENQQHDNNNINEDVVVEDMPHDEQNQDDAVIVEADDGSSQGSEVDDEEEFNPYAFIKSLPAYEDVKSFCPPDRLPAKDVDAPPISLVLDLDETLVHCTVEAVDDADLTFPVEFHGMTYQVYVRLRPHLQEFLEAIADKFEVIVFTASQQVYADALLNLIDPENKYIKHRMFRESCLSVEGNFLKDLNVLGRDLKKSVLVDNSPHAFGYQVDNGIPIESWFDDRNDTELLKLERFLRTLHGAKDVRAVVRRSFQTYRLIANAP